VVFKIRGNSYRYLPQPLESEKWHKNQGLL